jgi:hypothetical protein
MHDAPVIDHVEARLTGVFRRRMLVDGGQLQH